MDQPDFLAVTRDSYDRTAELYGERFHRHLDNKPVDLAVVSAFAGLLLKEQARRVVDVGCGTGATTALLNRCGVEAVGVDLSPNMVRQARRLNPGLRFDVGSMTNLEIPDSSVGGICAWYSIIHVPDDHLSGVFGQFNRVLAPGGLVLLAFQVGDEPRVLNQAFGHDVNLTFIRRQPRSVADQLTSAGFSIYATLVRQPDDDGFESSPHAYLIARKLF